MKVCSAHFVEDDFFWSRIDANIWTPVRKRLKKTAIPSQCLPNRTHDHQDLRRAPASAARAALASARDSHVMLPERSGISDLSSPPLAPSDGDTSTGMSAVEDDWHAAAFHTAPHNGETVPNPTMTDAEVAEVMLQLAGHSHTYIDKGVQVDTLSAPQRKRKVVELLTTDVAVRVFTGVKSKSAPLAISEEVALVDEMTTDIPVYERVVLVLVRLKTCLSLNCLATLFCTSKTTVQRHFYGTLRSLAAILKAAIPWPSKNEIMLNMPHCFAQFQEVRVVLDCTEVQVEKSHCQSYRILTYSYYKGTYTAKALVGVSPAGLITFISNGFGGRASDKACVLKSNVLDKLKSFEDDVMVDKGFCIDDMCAKRGLGVVQPPFLRSEEQFSAEDATKTVHIARTRVHVERAIQRMKVFKVLKGPIPWDLVGALDQIMVIIAGIVHLSAPILSEKRFSGGVQLQ
ncbi:hypothetical protein V5799_028023 [Amblyomma americanum]|uniref:DDE Tnp4 domain-containing protein n=1 Tax=Amblyomma americanum TaxID=6943 RepID=A0AAQ4DE19_AMBAM